MQTLKLTLIKIIHTIIWAFFASLIFYVLYAGIANKINTYTWLAIGFVFLEVFTLIIFKWYCPLTIVARKYSNSDKENFDIYLPNWLAKHNKTIFTIIFVSGLFLIIIRTFL
ncbi:MAG: hypothetical protein C0597_14225 [Marinilabiliales bacterium]|nr:MAG: hypothetical protein C0597_14225 [Marinilabiliales bacterium]